MATAMKVCKVCGKRFNAKLRRQTCSAACHGELCRWKAKEQLKRIAKTSNAQEGEKHSKPYWAPTEDEIAQKAALIRSGRLIVNHKGATYIDPSDADQ